MTLLYSLILNRLYLNIIVRLLEQFSGDSNKNQSLSRAAVSRGIASAVLIASIPYLMYFFGNHTEHIYISIINVLVVFLGILYRCKKLPQQGIFLGVMSVYICILGNIYLQGAGAYMSILVISIAALTEELQKTMRLRPLYPHIMSDVIVLGICSGLGFAWMENIIYLITLGLQQVDIGGLVTQRLFSSIPLHALRSGMIGLLLMNYMLQKISRTFVIFGIFGIISMHICYNIFLDQGYILGTIGMLSLCYIGLSWLLIQGERIYLRTST